MEKYIFESISSKTGKKRVASFAISAYYICEQNNSKGVGEFPLPQHHIHTTVTKHYRSRLVSSS